MAPLPANPTMLRRQALTPKYRKSSVMPCTAKKFEIGRDRDANGVPDVDISITRELARMIKKSGIRFLDLPDEV